MANICKRTTVFGRDAEVSALWYETVFGMARWMDIVLDLDRSLTF